MVDKLDYSGRLVWGCGKRVIDLNWVFGVKYSWGDSFNGLIDFVSFSNVHGSNCWFVFFHFFVLFRTVFLAG